ncbi:MAG: DUF58 domain-containing protein [Planctomycetes bacterium]|nr:DUF58 domain-containing protein [Planctomycetota bacterium]
MSRRPPLPTLPPVFPPTFRTLLQKLLARGRAAGTPSEDRVRSARARLSQSGTFVGHRPYERGDDLRRLDWAAYARTGSLFVKQLEEEERRTAALLLDLSPSLLVGDPPRRLAMLRAAAVLGGLALARLDGIAVVAPGAGPAAIAPFAGVHSLDAMLHHLESLPVVASTPEAAIELVLQRAVPGRVHWLSDFAVPRDVERPLHALRRGGARVTGWLPELPGDHTPPPPGHLRVLDPVNGEELVVVVDAALAAELARQLQALAAAQNSLFAAAGARLVRWPATHAVDDAIAAWLPFLQRGAG